MFPERNYGFPIGVHQQNMLNHYVTIDANLIQNLSSEVKGAVTR